MTLVILYLYSVRYVWKLDSWAHILRIFSLILKPSMKEWYQSHVNHRNASLVRRVIFERLFLNQNYFYSIPLQNL
jgi:hypothetical protein